MKRLYVIRDNVAEAAAGPIMTLPNDAVATRTFGDIMADKQSMSNRHPEHYDLVCVGHFDDDACVVLQFASGVAQVVLTGAAWLAMQQPAGAPELVREA